MYMYIIYLYYSNTLHCLNSSYNWNIGNRRNKVYQYVTIIICLNYENPDDKSRFWCFDIETIISETKANYASHGKDNKYM